MLMFAYILNLVDFVMCQHEFPDFIKFNQTLGLCCIYNKCDCSMFFSDCVRFFIR